MAWKFIIRHQSNLTSTNRNELLWNSRIYTNYLKKSCSINLRLRIRPNQCVNTNIYCCWTFFFTTWQKTLDSYNILTAYNRYIKIFSSLYNLLSSLVGRATSDERKAFLFLDDQEIRASSSCIVCSILLTDIFGPVWIGHKRMQTSVPILAVSKNHTFLLS